MNERRCATCGSSRYPDRMVSYTYDAFSHEHGACVSALKADLADVASRVETAMIGLLDDASPVEKTEARRALHAIRAIGGRRT